MIIAIDGPVGAGKSSIARRVAERLGFDYLETGALYRAVALAALEAGIPSNDHDGIAALARRLDVRPVAGRVLVDGQDVTERVRAADVTDAVPAISAIPAVRAALISGQRAAGEAGNVVMEGRDLGTVVVPDADVKVFLTASLEERARRRARQAGQTLQGEEFAELVSTIAARDASDSTRPDSPLRKADDAVVIDSTDMSENEVVDRILELAKRARD
jgi:CMP/dCMP kinase